LDDVLIDGVNHVQDLVTELLELFDEGGGGYGSLGFSGDEVDVLLVLLHAGDVILEGSHFLTTLGGVVTEEFRELGTIGGIFVDTQLKVLSELFVELLIILGILTDLLDELQTLLGDVLLDNLQDLVVLEEFSGNVKG